MNSTLKRIAFIALAFILAVGAIAILFLPSQPVQAAAVSGVNASMSLPSVLTDEDGNPVNGFQVTVNWTVQNTTNTPKSGNLFFWFREGGTTGWTCVEGPNNVNVPGWDSISGSTTLNLSGVVGGLPGGDLIEAAATFDSAANCGAPPDQPSGPTEVAWYLSEPSASAPVYANNPSSVPINWTATNSTGNDGTVVIFWRKKASPPDDFMYCTSTGVTLKEMSGSAVEYVDLTAGGTVTWSNNDVAELLVVVTSGTTGCPANDASGLAGPHASTTIDTTGPVGYVATGPRNATASSQDTAPLFCNSSEVFAVAMDEHSGVKRVDITTDSLHSFPAGGSTFIAVTQTLSIPGQATAVTANARAFDMADNKSPAASARVVVNRTGLSSTDPDKQPCPSFTDVPDGAWYATYVRYLAAAGIISGFGDGTFRPNDTITRAQMAKLLVASLGYTTSDLPSSPPSEACTFADVSEEAWYAGWVWKACALGLMQGYGDGTFGPDDPVTRGQAATAIWRLKGASDKTGTGFVNESVVKNENRTLRGMPSFTDVPVGSYYADAVVGLYNIGIIDGYPDNTFRPDNLVTRAEMAKILYRALGHWFDLQ